MANLSSALGASLTAVSARYWDQNEALPQLTGAHTMLVQGYSVLLCRLAQGIDIKYNVRIKHIDYSTDNEVSVTASDGSIHKGEKLLITAPLAVLKQNSLMWDPPLPDDKREAIQKLGAGIVEKVILQFPRRFWDKVLSEYGGPFFGCVPIAETPGMFTVFYDTNPHAAVLTASVSGPALAEYRGMSDEAVVSEALNTLRTYFPRENIPEPVRFRVSRWSDDENVGMTFSFLPVGVSGHTYDVMAQSVGNSLYFAGEATSRQFPQSVSGAVLSGWREAEKIVKSYIKTEVD